MAARTVPAPVSTGLCRADRPALLRNQLARIVLHAELIVQDPGVSREMREHARSAIAAAFEADQTLRGL